MEILKKYRNLSINSFQPEKNELIKEESVDGQRLYFYVNIKCYLFI